MWYQTRVTQLVESDWLRQAAIAREKWEMLLLWSGEIAPVLNYHRAEELMKALVEEADAYFRACRSNA